MNIFANFLGVQSTTKDEQVMIVAAVDDVGMSSMFTFLKSLQPCWKSFAAMMKEMVGDEMKDKAQFEPTSPALDADRIKTPLFIA